jgi:hypothetical protein
MELAWWEATGLFFLFLLQFVNLSEASAANVHLYVTWAYLAWCACELLLLLTGKRKAVALRHFRAILSPPA